MYAKVVASSVSLLFAACSAMQTPGGVVDVPDKLKPVSKETIALIVPAKGVQIYECRAKTNEGAAYEWAFVGPEADLFDSRGTKIGRHYAGPHWEATDGSRIAGKVRESATAPRADAIPWLLLNAKSVGSQGSFSGITSIQRVNTMGGVAPKAACSQSSLGTFARIPYTADYYFLTAK